MSRPYLLLILFFGIISAIGRTGFAEYNPVDRASVQTSGDQARRNSIIAGISASADGRYVVFQSESTNLVGEDTNSAIDIFLRDRTGTSTDRVSISNTEEESNGDSFNAQVSADGRYVVFESVATNLINSDTNGFSDIFLRDRTSATTIRVSVATAGTDGDGDSRNPRISADGRYVIFESDATDLVAGDNNDETDVFLRDTVGSTTIRVSLKTGGTEGDGASSNGGISDDGAFAVFESVATDLVVGDTNGDSDVFLHQIAGGVTTRISINSTNLIQGDAASGGPVISGDGAFVAFHSDATNLVSGDTNAKRDLFFFDRVGAILTRASLKTNGQQADGDSEVASLSSTGRYLAFESDATDLVSNDTNGARDLFVRDRVGLATVRVSVTPFGRELDLPSVFPALNSNANFLAFTSADSELVSTDTNEAFDIFVINLQCRVAPAGVVPLDTDADGTDDCTEDCPVDPLKLVSGACGCGFPDTDTDGDATEDCVEVCDTDPLKTDPGECGCGEVEVDNNGNGVSDCLDPTTATLPRKAVLKRLNSQKVRLKIPDDFSGVTYRAQLILNGQVVKKKSGQAARIVFRAPGPATGRDTGSSCPEAA